MDFLIGEYVNTTTKTNSASSKRDYSNDDKTQFDKQKKMKQTRAVFKYVDCCFSNG